MYNRDLVESQMGLGGIEYAGDTVKHVAPSNTPYIQITVVAAATFSEFTGDPAVTGTITGIAFPAGMTIYGRVKSFTLTSGSVIAYKAACPV